jgi:hypothetical protein
MKEKPNYGHNNIIEVQNVEHEVKSRPKGKSKGVSSGQRGRDKFLINNGGSVLGSPQIPSTLLVPPSSTTGKPLA